MKLFIQDVKEFFMGVLVMIVFIWVISGFGFMFMIGVLAEPVHPVFDRIVLIGNPMIWLYFAYNRYIKR